MLTCRDRRKRDLTLAIAAAAVSDTLGEIAANSVQIA
jgi:hypothetical protein